MTPRSSADLVPLPGDESPNWAGYTLACIAEIALVLTPWATWIASPSISSRARWRRPGDGLHLLDQ